MNGYLKSLPFIFSLLKLTLLQMTETKECLRLEGISEGNLVQSPCSSRKSPWPLEVAITYLLWIHAGCPGLCIPWRKETPQPLWATCSSGLSSAVKKCVLMFREKLLCFILCTLPLVLSLAPLKRIYLHLLSTLLSGIYTHW